MKNSLLKPKVLLVGVFHMGGSSDIHSTELDNLLSPTRQQEIREVVESIKRFNPTKVALEIVTEDDEAINNTYKAYIDGQYELRAREHEQLGFRIASELGHEKVYPIDWMETGVATRGCGEIYDWAKINQPELFSEIWSEQDFIIDTNKSILDMYRVCNDLDEIKKSHHHYINMARIGHVREYVGIDWLIWWYQRNLILSSNISRLATSENERILVIIGCAHKYLLDQFLRESGVVELVDVNKLLVSSN